MVQYHFVTQWFFHVPIERVWQQISDREHWSDWLQDFRRVTPIAPTDNGETAFEIEYWGNLPYTFRFILTPTAVEPPHQYGTNCQWSTSGTGVLGISGTRRGNPRDLCLGGGCSQSDL